MYTTSTSIFYLESTWKNSDVRKGSALNCCKDIGWASSCQIW